MKVTIERGKASTILHDGKFYDTGKEIDLSFSEAVRMTRHTALKADYAQVQYDAALWQEKKFVNMFGDIDLVSGFGGVSYNLLRYSAPRVQTAIMGKMLGARDQVVFAAHNRDMQQGGAMVWHDQPREQWLYSPFERNIAIVPFETTRVPRSWVGKINGFKALFVPCKQNIQMFRDSGVVIPIELIHWGVDERQYHPIERKPSDVFTFGHMGALSIRKGTDILVKAFLEAFPTEKDVRLICKSSFPTYQFGTTDKRVEVFLNTWTHEELLRDFFTRIDCFVFPTRGEGFGLTPLEAMATGIPAIVTGWSGPVEYMTPEVGWTIDHTFSPAKNFSEIVYKEDCGDWAEPSKDHLIALMRHAYENREETRAKGAAAAQYVKENWLWSKKILMYEDALTKHL